MGFFQDLLGTKKKSSYPSLAKIEIPPFTDDPYVGKSQDYLWNFGTNMLDGKLPDTYQPLTEFGSQQFEDMLGLTNRDIAKSVTDSAVRTGMGRSGVIGSNIAKATADASVKARYGDYTNTLTNLKSLLGVGLDTVSGVRTAGLQNQDQKNTYELRKAGLNIDQNSNLYAADQNTFAYDQTQESQSASLNDVLGGVGDLFGDSEGQDNLLGQLMSMFGGSQSSTKQGSAETGKKTDWLQTGMDVSKLVAMFAAV